MGFVLLSGRCLVLATIHRNIFLNKYYWGINTPAFHHPAVMTLMVF